MKSFSIVLKNYQKSEYFFAFALESSKNFNWNLHRFDAIDGRNISSKFLSDHNLKICTAHKKFVKQFERPGVLGCFLSHYFLWNKCIELNEPIGIFEEDVIFLAPPIDFDIIDVLKFEKKKQGKDYISGSWWEGAYAYAVTPSGAKKLIAWTKEYGMLPADVMLGTNVVDIRFNEDHLVTLNLESQINNNYLSTTQNLNF